MSNYDYESPDIDDPSFVYPADHADPEEELEVADLAELLKNQAALVGKLQKKVAQHPGMDVRELKEVATATTGLIASIHRTGELLKSLETYKLFVSVVLRFVKERGDETGQDLHAELVKAAEHMGAAAKLRNLL